MNITILNYTGNESNWGCQATSKNMIKLLKYSYGNDISFKFIDIEYSGSIYRRLLNKIRFKSINIILKNIVLFTNIFKIFHPLENSNLEKINNCDLLILNGEGSLHGYNSELIKFIQYLGYAKLIGVETAIINHSLQFDNDNSKKYLEILYKYSNKNYFREGLSLNNAKEINVKNLYIVPDAAFLNYEIDTSSILINNLPKDYILSTGSVILKNNNHELYFTLLKKLSDYYNLPVLYIASCDVDKNFKDLVINKYSFTYFDNNDLSVEQVQKCIKDSFFFYSGRFHPNIFSASVGKLFIPFNSNTVKMQGFLNLIDYPIQEIDLNKIDLNIEFNKIIEFIKDKLIIEKNLLINSNKQVSNLKKHYKKIIK